MIWGHSLHFTGDGQQRGSPQVFHSPPIPPHLKRSVHISDRPRRIGTLGKIGGVEMRMGGKEELGRGNAEWAKKAKPRKRERKEGAACAGNFFL